MDVLQRPVDFLEERLVPLAGLPAGFADVEVMHLPIEDVLEALAGLREVELLDDVEALECLQVAIDAGPVDVGHLLVEEALDVFQGELLALVVQDELKQEAAPGGDPHLMGLEDVGEIPVFLHAWERQVISVFRSGHSFLNGRAPVSKASPGYCNMSH